jgi:hypothetical protein
LRHGPHEGTGDKIQFDDKSTYFKSKIVIIKILLLLLIYVYLFSSSIVVFILENIVQC